MKRFILYMVAGMAVNYAAAAPFARWFNHRLADGRAVRIWGEGDEYNAHFEDADGYTIIYNPALGNYVYAMPAQDGALVQSLKQLGEGAPAGIEKHLADTSAATAEAARERLREKAEETGLAQRWANLKNAASADAPRKAPPKTKTTGTITGVTLLVDFPMFDEDGNETNTLANAVHPGVTKEDLDALVNGDDFTKYGNASSVRTYYKNATSGHVDYTNAVIGWVKVPYARAWYDDTKTSSGTCGRRLIGDALAAMKSDARYESEFRPLLEKATANADGEILALNVLFAGEEASTWSYGLWAHQYFLTSSQYKNCYVTIGGKKCNFYSYQISPVTSSPTIHTFCHESGHMICDFPDLYAYTGFGNGVGNWCLMCGRTDDCHPQNFSAYLRAAAGWVEPKTLPSASGWVSVKADLQDVWKFPHPTDKKQYYLIENRQATGTDVNLLGSGIVIYRCDEAGDNTTGAKTTKSVFTGYSANRLSYEVSVEQADGLYEIERAVKGHWNGDATDTWYEGNPAEGYANQFNASSTPCARWKDGTAAKINIFDFSANGETMQFWNEVETDEIDLSSAIYVNGIDTSKHSSHESAGEATYWRVTKGRIVLRGGGPYTISGTGTTPVRCAVTSDKWDSCKVVISDLNIRSADEDYGAFDCGLTDVKMAISGTNTLVSTAYSDKKSRPAIYVKSGVTLTISGSDDARLTCMSGKYAAGIGGGYDKGLLTISDNDAGTVKILGGNIEATGGYNGAGIGGGSGGTLGRVDVYDALVTARGGTGAAGIGGGYKGSSGHFFNYGGTVWATGGNGDGTTSDIGRGAGSTSSLLHRLYIAGGSTSLANGYVTGMMPVSNKTERVYRTITPNLMPAGRYVFAGLPEGYGQDRIVADSSGAVHLWLPAGEYSYKSSPEGIDFTAGVSNGRTEAAASSDYWRWLKKYTLIASDIPTAAERAAFETDQGPCAKRQMDGSPMTVRDEYICGLDPNDPASVFKANIEMDADGLPVVTPDPDLGDARIYRTFGKETLEGEWQEADRERHRFFKIDVALEE
ncbi:MAG: M6 family metalloprotease domain-containing protein [Kiritimatiellae bacterium]|nr:M6 family metalloprotease domain-containing protein [Kiritimatiellia bacterium]